MLSTPPASRGNSRGSFFTANNKKMASSAVHLPDIQHIALTIGATPLISERARQYEFVRSTEASIMQRVDGLLARLPSKED